MGEIKSFKQYLKEMSWDISELDPYGQADRGTHEVSKRKLKGTEEIYYVKFSDEGLYDDLIDASIHPIVEYLSYKIYKLFKVKVPEVDLVIDGNRLGLASKESKGKIVPHLDLLKTNNISSMFAPSAFIANWDVMGTGCKATNIIVDDSGNATLIDPGGALTFRARGGRKGSTFSNSVGEVETLQDPEMSQAAEVFQGVDVSKSLKDFSKISWNNIKKLLVKEHKYISEVTNSINKKLDNSWQKEYKVISSTLENRYKDMIKIIKKIT